MISAMAIAACTLATAQVKEDFKPASTNQAGKQYPMVNSERVVRAQVTAPDAKYVQFDIGGVKYDLVKDENGVWTGDTAPQDEGFHYYQIWVDGAATPDPNSLYYYGASRWGSGIEIPAHDQDFYAVKNVPHGDVREVHYWSETNKEMRHCFIYTPASYDTDLNKRYPVLYLQHGGGENEHGWAEQGKTALIMDNLIAAGKAEPMLVVMPNGNPSQYASQTLGIPEKKDIKKYSSNFDNYSSLVADIVPFIESRYNVIAKKSGRAIAGLSMGGGQSFYIGFRNADKFSSVGIFSSGLIGSSAIGREPFDAEKQVPGMLTTPEKFNRFDVIYLACGEQDNRIDGMKAFKETLDSKGYEGVVWEQCPGGHEWKVWRRDLTSFAQRIFK